MRRPRSSAATRRASSTSPSASRRRLTPTPSPAALPGPIRRARADEVEQVREVDHAAGELFREFGMPEVADDSLPPLSEYERYVRSGDLWVVAADAPADGGDGGGRRRRDAVVVGRPVAFAIVENVDDDAHVDQLSVDPAWSRRGIGSALLDHVAELARADGRPAVTLTTFVSVPWNAPYYRRLGFVEVPEAEMGPALASLVAAERRRWTGPRHARIAMRRPV